MLGTRAATDATLITTGLSAERNNILTINAGRLDVLVNNTGIVKDSLFASMSFDDFYSS
jgi:NAD(P)-dependent dehydrogenase (short-subunit alcohol dehydrogenase family)